VVEPVLLWGRLVGAQIRSQLQYRVSFTLDLFGSFLISFVDFLAVLVIFHNVPRLGTWSVSEVAFLYALSSISFAFTDLAIGHLDQFPQKIRDGTFDILLVRPRGSLYQVVASDFQLRRLGKAVQCWS
jgi:ABC-2 type transport system permease protein